MPRGLTRFHSNGHLHFITFSCYHRLPKLGDAWARDQFVAVLEEMRVRWRFQVLGYVVMPEHVHLLISEPEEGTLAIALQLLKQNTSRRLRLCVGGEPVWQARYYDFNVWSEKKVEEKLWYMHQNPVRRGLVLSEFDWPWSSAGFYAGVVWVETSLGAGSREDGRAVVVSHPSR